MLLWLVFYIIACYILKCVICTSIHTLSKGGWILNETRRHKERYIEMLCNGTEIARYFNFTKKKKGGQNEAFPK